MKFRPIIQTRLEPGFTLVELLVVVAIIGILAAIAIPQFSEFRERGFDARSVEELRNAATAEEAYFADHSAYVDCVGGAACEAVLPEFRHSPDVDIAMTRVPAAGQASEHFVGRTFHSKGSRNSAINAYQWDSSQGGLQ